MRLDDLRALSIFDGLTDDQLAELLSGGTEVRIEPGTVLFREGQPAEFWWVLVDGAIELLRRTGREDTVVARMDVPGRWAGGFRAWDEHGTYLATGRGVLAGRVLRVPSEVLRERASSWFPFAAHLIEGLYRTARSIESTARQRASLVTLGTLAAGIAHEINNPASAATRAVDALETTTQVLLTSVGRLAREEVPADKLVALDELRREIRPPVVEADSLVRADHEQALATWLSRRGVVRAWSIAPPLAAAGVNLEWCARAETVLGPAALEPGLEWLASTFSSASLLAELKESTRRISELVAAVRSYTQLDRASMQQIDVADGLDSTLLMLGHKLRGGVTVVRDYGEVPEVEAYAGELNQVWTNLIDNAVDAMDGKGTLRVATRVEDGQVLVEIGDTGVGMASEIAARAFEAFFTTKDVGKGLGLGLDIARRIVVERHGGTISINSRPGETVLRVGIPFRPPKS
jgi:signal transduction histidine kinase